MDLDPDSYWFLVGWSRIHKNRKISDFMFWSVGCSLLRSEGYPCSLGVLHRGLGITKMLILFKSLDFLSCKIVLVWSSKRCIRIRIRIRNVIRIRTELKFWIRIHIETNYTDLQNNLTKLNFLCLGGERMGLGWSRSYWNESMDDDLGSREDRPEKSKFEIESLELLVRNVLVMLWRNSSKIN